MWEIFTKFFLFIFIQYTWIFSIWTAFYVLKDYFVFQHVKRTQSSMKMSLFSCEGGNLCTSWKTFSRLIIRSESDTKETMHKLSRLAQKCTKKEKKTYVAKQFVQSKVDVIPRIYLLLPAMQCIFTEYMHMH